MDNSQVAHLWANKSRESAKGSNFYFEGDTIYSYGSHFPIARHYKGVILFTSHDYSVSTSKHKSYARSACSHLTVYHVEDPRRDPSGKDVANYGERIKNASLAVARARDPQWKLKWLEELIEEANNFCALFGFKTRFSVPENMDELKEHAKQVADKKRKQTIARQEKAEREQAELIKRWLSGEMVSLPFQVQKVYLRTRLFQAIGIERMEMETSKGATVPIEDAHKAFRFVMLKREKGWHRNGDQFPIGEFHLDAVNEQGVVAGCHRITWDEIERFAKSQNWI
jgi:ribosomal protein L9